MGSLPAQTELLSENEHTRVVRLHLPEGRTVIRKEPLGPAGEDRVSHETAILRRLTGVAHVIQLAAQQPDPRAIFLEDVHGTPLAQVPTPLEGSRMLGLMLGLARAVAALHERGVVHGDINPGNILLAEDAGSPYLIDFALAWTFAELRPEFTHYKEIVGTLPYLAPEQTGRTGRSIDRRADLYGLGATMYELATGRPPFGTGDPIQLIHDHLARAPVSPAAENPAVPAALSDIVMHLLEKEPDNRYQTAQGLIRDLERVRDGARTLTAGEDDIPMRLTEPSRLVGRDHEIDLLRSAFEGALAGECRRVVVSGESGVGKSALIEQLRPIVTAGDGWFTYGKFDRYRHDQEYDGVGQAFRGLGRLLLAEPEDELADIRERILRALGNTAGLAAAVIPEFATLLKVPPDPGDPVTAQARARRNALEILRAVASRKRPVVFVIDDMQWAGATPLGLLDQLLSGEESIGGLLTVGVFRETEVDESHVMASMIERWRRQPEGPEFIALTNLDRERLAALIGEMLRSHPDTAARLAGPLFGPTRGNPFETVQLVNGLRREGVLVPTGAGWAWDPAALDRRLAAENVPELMQARLDAMPVWTRRTLDAMACMGGELGLNAIEVATGQSAAKVAQRLAPALADGMLAMVSGLNRVRFHHDRFRDIVLAGIPRKRLRPLRLRMARRLADRPEHFAVAADLYLPVADAVTDPEERRRVADLFRQSGNQSMWIGESLPAERMLDAAVRIVDDPEALIQTHTLRHTALFRLGRFEDADAVYEALVGLGAGPFDRVEATRVQISSLTNRFRADDAITLGLELLKDLGWAVPAPDAVNHEIDQGLDWCARWIAETTVDEDLLRPDVTDRTVVAAGSLMSRMMPACFFRDQVTMAWLALSATRVWAEQGPSRTLLGVVAHLPWAFIGRRENYRAGHTLLRRVLAVGEARGYEPDLSQARFLYFLGLSHWFDPLEDEAAGGDLAREGLIRGGDPQAACYTYCAPLYAVDRATTVDAYAVAVDAALAYAERTGNQHAAGLFQPYRWLVAALRGEPTATGAGEMADRLEEEPVAAVNVNTARALAAAILDDPDALDQYSKAAMSLRSAVEATYVVWQAHVLRALALADRVRTTDEHAAELAELDAVIEWINRRAADMPMNFRHMMRLAEAERAWAVGEFRPAIHAFDAALRDSDHRPWHRAYIAERSGRFMLAHGLDHAGWSLLLEAREAYRVWGARAKVDQIDRAYPSFDVPADSLAGHATTRRASITAGAIDMLGIVAASRALSSETNMAALRRKVVEVLSAMTGATDVGLLIWNTDKRRWLVATDDREGTAPVDPHRVPQSVVRYVERTREPLIVDDATRDDRFARDPYFIDLNTCSILVVPVLSRGALQAILLLENRLIRDAFPVERLEGVMLIAGQLAVSLDNALIYASLERKVAERTQQLARANKTLAQLSTTDPLTGVANRRRMGDALQEEWSRARRARTPLTLAMVDIDHFKRYNDEHGHRAGDRCLQHVATQVEHHVRDTDLVARYGGEEFAIIMPDTGSAAGKQAAERVRVAITELGVPLTDGRVVTASVGVATLYDFEHESIDQLIERADAALYRAKRDGRNRVCSADVEAGA